MLDVYSDEGVKGGESVWHTFGLKDGNNDVRLVVLGEPYPGSTCSAVAIASLIVYR